MSIELTFQSSVKGPNVMAHLANPPLTSTYIPYSSCHGCFASHSDPYFVAQERHGGHPKALGLCTHIGTSLKKESKIKT